MTTNDKNTSNKIVSDDVNSENLDVKHSERAAIRAKIESDENYHSQQHHDQNSSFKNKIKSKTNSQSSNIITSKSKSPSNRSDLTQPSLTANDYNHAPSEPQQYATSREATQEARENSGDDGLVISVVNNNANRKGLSKKKVAQKQKEDAVPGAFQEYNSDHDEESGGMEQDNNELSTSVPVPYQVVQENRPFEVTEARVVDEAAERERIAQELRMEQGRQENNHNSVMSPVEATEAVNEDRITKLQRRVTGVLTACIVICVLFVLIAITLGVVLTMRPWETNSTNASNATASTANPTVSLASPNTPTTLSPSVSATTVSPPMSPTDPTASPVSPSIPTTPSPSVSTTMISPTMPPVMSPTRSPTETSSFTSVDELYDAVDQYIMLGSSSVGEIALKYGHAMGDWDVSQLSNFSRVFSTERNPAMLRFNEDISQWDTSRAEIMNEMFQGARTFDQDISKWNVSNVRDFSGMFANATLFSGDISTWDVSRGTTMRYMFRQASSFDRDLSIWDVSRVEDFGFMFAFTRIFNGDISTWNTSNANSMYSMFRRAQAFNQDLSLWDVSNTNDMRHMFDRTASFNGNIRGWDVSALESTHAMFRLAVSFDQNLCDWGSRLSADVDTTAMFRDSGCPNRRIPDLTAMPPGPFCHRC